MNLVPTTLIGTPAPSYSSTVITTEAPDTLGTSVATSTMEPSYKDCEETFDYLELLHLGLSDEEMLKRMPCTVIRGRHAFWEYQHFKRSKL